MLAIVTIVGARPQFVKAAVISRLVRSPKYRSDIDELIVHTGQHYDEGMSQVFFDEMHIPAPAVNLGVGGVGHGAMTGRMLERLEALLQERRPDLVLIYGDTDSTLAGALAAAKLNIPLAHVEAGLRSFRKSMPEEINRRVADHVSTLLYCPTPTAVRNLELEGIVHGERPIGSLSNDRPIVENVGDVMLDASLYYRGLAEARPSSERVLPRLGLRAPFRLLTLHRAENTDDLARMRSIFEALNEERDVALVFPVHPRTRKRIAEHGIKLAPHIFPIDPVGYFDMLELESACEVVVTDSGGVQKEAYFWSKPCITLREETEWVETVETGWNRLVGADAERISEALHSTRPGADGERLYGDGNAGERIVDSLLRHGARLSGEHAFG